MKCPQCDDYEIGQGEKDCLMCGYSLAQKPSLKSVINPTQTKSPLELTTAITLDGTGSSNGFRDGIKLALELSLKPIEEKVAKLSIYFQKHGDLDYGEKEVLLTENGNLNQVLNDASKVVYSGGGDGPETHLDAINNLVKIVPWRFDSKRRNVLLMICNDETKELRSKKSPEVFGKELNEKGFLVILVCEPTPKLTKFINAASGIMIPIKNNLTPDEFQEICKKITASIAASISGKCGTVPLNFSNNYSI